MSWFSIRTVYLHGEGADGSSVYEERTLLFRADSAEQAFDMSEVEAIRYLEVNPTFRRVGRPVGFKLGAMVDDLHGAEVWSVLGTSNLGPEDFMQKYNADVEFRPEDFQEEGDDGPAA